MAWDDQQPPWGKPGRPSSPEDLIAALINKLKQSFSGGNGSGNGSGQGGKPPLGKGGGIGKILLVILAIIAFQILYSSFYTIEPGQRGVLLRFGQYNKIAQINVAETSRIP